jgi:hypothetical protein
MCVGGNSPRNVPKCFILENKFTDTCFHPPKAMVEELTFQILIPEIPGSNFGPDIDYTGTFHRFPQPL